VTKILAEFIANTGFNKFSKNVIEHAKICFLDWLGAALVGIKEKPAKIALSFIRDVNGRKESSIVGLNVKTSCINAALVNGVAGHCVELDDIHEEAIIHPAAPVIPAALAVGEKENIDGKTLLTSIILGYEVEIRVSKAINPSHYNFWHPTGTCGCFGSAAAVGKILGLNLKKMVYTFGIAGTQASGLIEVFGSMSKPFNAGKAAVNGIIAAMLAKRGFDSSQAIFEAEKGFCRATAEKVNLNRVIKNLGENFEILNNIFKRYASCGHTHAAIDAILKISEEHNIKPSDVDKIVVKTYPIAVKVVGKNFNPKTPLEAKFSLPYCIAAALVYGKVGLDEFSRRKLKNLRIRKIMEKISIKTAPKYAEVKLGSAEVIVCTKKGKKYSCQVDKPKGYPENPLTIKELEEKFTMLAGKTFSEEKIREIIRMVRRLDKLRNIKDLTSLLSK